MTVTLGSFKKENLKYCIKQVSKDIICWQGKAGKV